VALVSGQQALEQQLRQREDGHKCRRWAGGSGRMTGRERTFRKSPPWIMKFLITR